MYSVLITKSESRPVRDDIVIADLPVDWVVETLEVDGAGIEGATGAELADAVDGHDGLILRPGVADRDLFKGAPSLKVVAVYGSGYDRVDLDAATEHGVVVTHSPGAPGPAVVEYTIATMTMLLRDILGVHERTTRGEWQAAKSMGTELGRTTVGIVGLGTIGFDVARRASDVGAEVLGYDPYVTGDLSGSAIYPRHDRETIEAAGVTLVGLEELLDRSGLLSLHSPFTDATRGLIGASELEKLEGGYLINVARGGIVDESALLDAVEDGTIEGVVLDVMEAEPPEPDDPLLTSPEVIVTPHVAGVTDGYLERGAHMAAEKVETVLTGGKPGSVVNPEVYDKQ